MGLTVPVTAVVIVKMTIIVILQTVAVHVVVWLAG